MRPPSYIGLTGFTSRQQVALVLAGRPRNSTQLVMVGVLASDKSLRGEPSNPKRYPNTREWKRIFSDRDHVLNLLHFNTSEPERLLAHMWLAKDLAGPFCNGFQLNVAWPDPGTLEEYRSIFNNDTIVLQCGTRALDVVGHDPLKLAKKLEVYQGLIDYVLVDPSGGRGIDFEYRAAFYLLDSLYASLPKVGLGIAGGLSATNVRERVRRLLGQFKHLSIDAEGRLRDSNDHLDVVSARSYLDAAHELYHPHQ